MTLEQAGTLFRIADQNCEQQMPDDDSWIFP